MRNQRNYRTRFTWGNGHWSYAYFETLEDAENASATQEVQVNPWTMRWVTVAPQRQQVQVRGPRGGWSKAK